VVIYIGLIKSLSGSMAFKEVVFKFNFWNKKETGVCLPLS